jgi:hypothetical protein
MGRRGHPLASERRPLHAPDAYGRRQGGACVGMGATRWACCERKTKGRPAKNTLARLGWAGGVPHGVGGALHLADARRCHAKRPPGAAAAAAATARRYQAWVAARPGSSNQRAGGPQAARARAAAPAGAAGGRLRGIGRRAPGGRRHRERAGRAAGRCARARESPAGPAASADAWDRALACWLGSWRGRPPRVGAAPRGFWLWGRNPRCLVSGCGGGDAAVRRTHATRAARKAERGAEAAARWDAGRAAGRAGGDAAHRRWGRARWVAARGRGPRDAGRGPGRRGARGRAGAWLGPRCTRGGAAGAGA